MTAWTGTGSPVTWTERVPQTTVTGTTIADSGFGFVATASGTFDDAKIGYDNNADNDLDDPGDDILYNEAYSVTSTSPTYDNNGNLTEDPWYKYTYDAWNRLVKVTTRQDAVTIAAYTYGPTGRRIQKVVSNSGQRDGTQYFYYAKQHLLEQRDGSENVERQFIFGTQYIDEPIAMIDDPDGTPAWYFYHQDANYNVVALTDSTGAVAERYHYTPYGQLSVFDEDFHPKASSALPTGDSSITFNNPFTYTGRFYDVETGLYYYRGRYQHPVLARFIQRDPVALVVFAGSGYHDGMSLYEYARSNPSKYTDPIGSRARVPAYTGPYSYVSYQLPCKRGGFCWRYRRKKNCVDCYAINPCLRKWVRYARTCSACARYPGPVPPCPRYVPPRNGPCCAWARSGFRSRDLCKKCCLDRAKALHLLPQVRREWLINCETGQQCDKCPAP